MNISDLKVLSKQRKLEQLSIQRNKNSGAEFLEKFLQTKGMTVKEIAKELGLSEQAVYIRCRRAEKAGKLVAFRIGKSNYFFGKNEIEKACVKK